MPVFDFLYRIDELVADLDFFIAEPLPSIKRRWPPPTVPDESTIAQTCGEDQSRWLYSGNFLLQQGHGALAEVCFRKLCELAPARWADDAGMFASLGLARVQQERFEEAIELITAGVKRQPDQVEIRKRLILAYEQAQRPTEEILEQVNAALKIAPADAELLEKKEELDY